MESYKKEFIDFMVESKVLKFGEFTLKSGRKSPFFMNAGGYVTGSQLKRLGEYYAKAIHDKYGDDFDVLFGPAYKGIPLSVVTEIGLMVSLDRMEVGKGGVKCALEEVKDLYGFETNAIVTMAEVVEYLYNKEINGEVIIDDTLKAAIDAYYEQYGTK